MMNRSNIEFEYVDVTESKKVSYRKLFLLLLRKWRLLLLFVMLGFGIAYVYVMTVVPVYKVSTTLLVNSQNDEISPQSSDLMTGMNLFVTNRSFYNEVTVINSYPIVFRALSNLNFEVSYFEREVLRYNELYLDSPFLVIFNQGHPQPTGLKVHVSVLEDGLLEIWAGGKEVYLYSFTENKIVSQQDEIEIDETIRFGEEIASADYRFKIIPNSNLSIDEILGKKYYFTLNNMIGLADYYKAEMKVSLYSEQSTVAMVELLSSNTEKGINFLNSLTQEYIRNNLAKKNHIAQATIDYINNQLEQISDSLTNAEEKLQQFRTRYQVLNLDTKAEQIYLQLQTFQTDKAALAIRQNYYEYIKEHFDNNEDVSDLIAPSSMGIEDPLLGNLVQEFMALNSEKSTLIENSQQRSPYLKSLEIKMDNLRTTIYENILYHLNTNKFSQEDLDRRIETLTSELNSLPATERRLLGIQREFNLNDAVYNFLLQRRAEAQIAKASNLPTVDIVESPRRIGNRPVLPKKKIIYVLGIFLGFVLPASTIILRDLFRNVFGSYDEIRRITSIPKVGGILFRSDIESSSIVLNEPSSPITETFRKVLPNLSFYAKGAKQTTVLITSSISGEGKSFCALNLASVYALNKKKTILLCFDIRRADFYRQLGYKMDFGISTLLTNQSTFKNSIQSTSNEYLTIIPPGATPPNPAELIASEESSRLLGDIKKSYEVVIIDTPPIGILVDAYHLLEQADINICVVRLNYTPRDIFISTIQELESKQLNNLSLLVNGNSQTQRGYGYYDRYYKSNSNGTQKSKPKKT